MPVGRVCDFKVQVFEKAGQQEKPERREYAGRRLGYTRLQQAAFFLALAKTRLKPDVPGYWI
jgi:hypothetical protein